MFKVFIAGKTIKELKSNLSDFLLAIDGEEEDSTEPLDISQAEPGISVAPGAINVMSEQGPVHVPPLSPFGMPSFTPPQAAWDAIPPMHTPAQQAPIAPPPPPIDIPKPAPRASVSGVETDSKGLAWDDRIHAVTRAVNKDGSWRYRRGVEQTTINQVEAELRGERTSPQIPGVPSFTPNVVPFTAPGLPPAPEALHLASTPPPPAAAPVFSEPPRVATPSSPASIAPPNLSVHSFDTFKANLVATLTKLVADGKLTQEYINSLKGYFQVAQIWQVNLEQCHEMFESFVANGLIVKAQ